MPAIQQQTPATAPKSQVSPGSRAPSGDEREDQAVGDAFGALLALSRGTIGEQITGDSDRAASQMFDAKGEEAGGDRMSQLNKDYRSSVGDKSDQRADARTGVHARGDALLAEARDVSAAGQGDNDLLAKGGEGNAQDHFASLQTVGSRIDKAPVARSPVIDASRFDLDVQSRDSGSKLDVETLPPVDPARGAGVSAGAGAALVNANGSGSGSSVAEEIGQLLGASRIGEVQGARAAAAPQATDQRASSNDRQTQTPARAKQASPSANESKVVRENNRTPFDKLVGRMRLRMSEGRSSAQLRLNPPGLGRIRVDVRLAGDRLVVGVQAESETARELLSQRVEGLKATLKEQGIQIDRFEVVTNTNGGSQNETVVGGDTSDARQPSRENWKSSVSPLSRVGQGGANEDHDGSEMVGTASSVPTVAVDTRLDIRI